MSRRKDNILKPDVFDNKILYLMIVAIVIINFIVRIKIFTNVLSFDMAVRLTMSNFFTYYKLIWMLFISITVLLLLIFRVYKYKQKPDVNFVLLGTSLIISASIIATILDPFKEATIWGLYSRNNGLLAYISLFFLIYAISNFKVQTKTIMFLIHAVNITSIILIIIGIFQFFGIDMMNSMWFKQIYTPRELSHIIEGINITQQDFHSTIYYWTSSIFGQFNYFGAYCSILYPLITAFALKEKNNLNKIYFTIGSILLFLGTILAQSLGSILTLLLMILIIPVAFVNKDNYKSFILMCLGYIIPSIIINVMTNGFAFRDLSKLLNSITKSSLFIPAIIVVVLYVLLLTFRNKLSKHRYLLVSILLIITLLVGSIAQVYIVNQVAEKNMDMLSGRGYIWHYSNELIKTNYIFGYGPDNLYYNFPQENPHKDKFMRNAVIDKPHNMYLQVLLDIGLLGLVGFLLIFIVLLLKLNKKIDRETDLYKNTYIQALILVILAYMLQGVANDNHLTVQPIVYLLAGIGASLIKVPLNSEKLSDAKV